MQIETFNPTEHASVISLWLSARGESVPKISQYPKIGYLVRNEDDLPVAAGNLRLVEGGFAQLDGLVTNPEAKPLDRHKGIDLVVTFLLNHAKTLGINEVMSFTVDKSVLERSTKHGFRAIAHSLIVVNLSADAHSNPPGAK